MRKALAVAALILGLSLPVKAQTHYNLPNSSCQVQASNFLYCSSMGTVTINGTVYQTWLSAVDITNLYQNPQNSTVNTSTGSFNLQNVNTLVTSTMGFTGGTYTNYHLTVNFTGAFTGQMDLDLVMTIQPPPCYRGCRARWTAENVVLTLQ